MAKIKKIVFTVTNDLTYDQRMDRICNTLHKNGYDITLIGFFKKRSVKLENKDFKQIRLKLLFKKGKLFFLEYNLRLFWYLLFRKYHIYCGIDLDTLLPVYFNAWLKRKPVVYDAHEYYTELPEIVDRPVIKKIWLAVEKSLLPNIKYNYTVAASIADVLAEKYNQPFELIRNVPYLTMEPSEITRGKYILYQGALNKGRGLENLMLAMKNVDMQLYIAGEGDLSVELRAFASNLPHSSKVRFLGYIRPNELKQYTMRATIGINLVENMGLSYYYSLSNKFFDYIHANVPQITMNFPEYTKLNNEFNVALLINDLEPATIEKSINVLLNDTDLYHQLKENTRPAKQKLNWQMEELKLIELYKKIE